MFALATAFVYTYDVSLVREKLANSKIVRVIPEKIFQVQKTYFLDLVTNLYCFMYVSGFQLLWHSYLLLRYGHQNKTKQEKNKRGIFQYYALLATKNISQHGETKYLSDN